MLGKHFSRSAVDNVIKNITVIGGGIMGSGIAQLIAQADQNVTVVDLNEDLLKKTESNIDVGIKRFSKRINDDIRKDFIEKTKSRLQYTTDIEKSVENVDLVLETVIEKLHIKQKLFNKIDEIAAKSTIFSSNTSVIPIREIASVTTRSDKFVGLHFSNPPPLTDFLEVVRTADTSEETYQTVTAWGKSIGKACVTVKDTPGFIANRLIVPFVVEAMKIFERGDASKEDIDRALELSSFCSIGPFKLCDYLGLDTVLYATEGLHERIPGNPSLEPPEILRRMVEEGKLGVKTGEGFYKYGNLGKL